MLRDLVIEITEGQVSFFLVTVVRKDCVAQTDDENDHLGIRVLRS